MTYFQQQPGGVIESIDGTNICTVAVSNLTADQSCTISHVIINALNNYVDTLKAVGDSEGKVKH